MKIVFITTSSNYLGANRSMYVLIQELKNLRYEIIVCCPSEGELCVELEKINVSYWVVPFVNWAFPKYINPAYWTFPFQKKKNSIAVLSICEKVRATTGVDAIYTNSSLTGIGAEVAQAMGLPHIWHIREFGEADYNLHFMEGRQRFYEYANRAKAIIAVSKAIEIEVLAPVIAPKYAIHNGIFSQSALQKIGIQRFESIEKFTYVVIGLLHPTKGQMQALQAFHQVYKKNKNTRLWIIGSGRRLYTLRLKAYIKLHGLQDAVQMIDYIAKPMETIAQAHVMLMASKSEGMGRVTLEGMACGLPVIGYDGGGTPELVQHGVDGYLYKSQEECVSYMYQLSQDKELCKKMGTAGRRKVEQEYTVEDFARKINTIFEKAILNKEIEG